MVNIVVVFSKPEDGRSIKNILIKNGFSVTASCTSGGQVLADAGDLRDGIVISGYQFGDMTCRQMSEQLPREFDILMVASPRKWSGEDMGRIRCLSAPFKMSELVSAVRLLEGIQAEKRRQRRNAPRQRSEAERQVIDRAKELLMGRRAMSEAEAHRYLQKCSMDSQTGIVEAARMVLRLAE